MGTRGSGDRSVTASMMCAMKKGEAELTERRERKLLMLKEKIMKSKKERLRGICVSQKVPKEGPRGQGAETWMALTHGHSCRHNYVSFPPIADLFLLTPFVLLQAFQQHVVQPAVHLTSLGALCYSAKLRIMRGRAIQPPLRSLLAPSPPGIFITAHAERWWANGEDDCYSTSRRSDITCTCRFSQVDELSAASLQVQGSLWQNDHHHLTACVHRLLETQIQSSSRTLMGY